MMKALLHWAVFGLQLHMSEDAPAAAPEQPATINDTPDAPAVITERPASDTPDTTPTEPVTLTVPAEHADLMQRALALLERGEAWLKDNIEAGISHFEGLFKDENNNVG